MVHTSAENGVGTIVFDNPTRRNALSVDMMEATHTALGTFDADPGVAVVVLRGAGDIAFASGADISEFEEHQTSAEAQVRFDATAAEVFRTLREMATPTIAMISGYCLGGGLAVAIGTDIRIATTTSTFAIPAARLGLGYPLENTAALVSIVGPANAAEMLYSARRLTSAQAHSAGLVNRVVEVDELGPTVAELAGAIAANAPLTIRAAKNSIRAAIAPTRDDLAASARQSIADCSRSADIREGQRAFMDKRPPVFRGV
jgi:enoyl-CoA hydratase/carnithine racemase